MCMTYIPLTRFCVVQYFVKMCKLGKTCIVNIYLHIRCSHPKSPPYVANNACTKNIIMGPADKMLYSDCHSYDFMHGTQEEMVFLHYRIASSVAAIVGNTMNM